MTDKNYLTDQFLIAMPTLADPNFSHTVTYLCQHNEEGALGIMVNREHPMRVGELFEQLSLQPKDPAMVEQVVYFGGPVQPERGFVLHVPCGSWDSTLPVNSQISLTTSRDILEAIASGKGPEKWMIALGYAGWGEGQLEYEIQQNSWLNGQASEKIIFDLPSEVRWRSAAESIGVDISLISNQVGHC
jgi:putative transcriptional regulator